MMPVAIANWIRDVVMAPLAPGAGEPDVRRTCRCQWGPCGHCSGGRPENCARHLVVGCEAYILNRRRSAVAPVWLSGRPCRWLCPGPAEPLGTGQLELFPEPMETRP